MKNQPAFAELVAATNFSFLRGASSGEQMVLRSLALDQNGLGVADRNTVAGVVRAYAALKQLREEKTLPMLNELGVERLSFVYAEFSQKNHKLDYDRMQRILINSCQQCGRSTKMILEEFSSLSTYFKAYPHSSILDFSEVKLDTNTAINSILIGPEGGFSTKEREAFHQKHIVGLTCNTILRSETAVVSVASKILA